MRRLLKIIVLFPPGLLLYLFNPGFRSIVKAKRSGPDDPVSTGENVIAVLNTGGQVQTVGGRK